jgi:hypothetical protein
MLAWVGGSKRRLRAQLLRKPRVQGVHVDKEDDFSDSAGSAEPAADEKLACTMGFKSKGKLHAVERRQTSRRKHKGTCITHFCDDAICRFVLGSSFCASEAALDSAVSYRT